MKNQKDFFSNCISIIRRMYNDIKEFYQNKSNLISVKIFKVAFPILLIIGIYFLAKYILPTIVMILVIWFLITYQDKPVTYSNYQNNYAEHEIARSLLFKVLSEKSAIIDVEKPSSIEDITPTQYFVLNKIQNLTFFRFIVRKKPDLNYDFLEIEESLNIWIKQLLQHGFPNVEMPFYRDLPYFSVFDVDMDSHHVGYLSIDIMPVMDDSYYEYLKTLEYQKNIIKSGMNQPLPIDEDF